MQVLPTIDQILNNMEDSALRKLLGVPSLRLSESEQQAATDFKEQAAINFKEQSAVDFEEQAVAQ